MIPVVIGTNPERREWLSDCIRSIRTTSKHRRVLVHDTGGFEIAALRTGLKHFDRFVFLHDSCEVLHPDFWTIVDNTPPAWLFGGPPMYMAVHDGPQLATAIHDAPAEMNKVLSIVWEGEIAKRLPYPTLWPEVHDGTAYLEERNGRQNLVLENKYLRKRKGHWGQGGPEL